ncbi:maltooligosyl trehalose hydrolase [Pedobacter psychrotolerans]|uniref:Malto-oligosyltrehalose trehalohydrolase n=1 Tax=Pedobacter psychrotolerans TaxID=1843235 RepID=A0A4R2H682_9SPHI|nr:malto-oligosyltrehalose trehalohydrolase [Pedobacter psychrotolerans]TCO21580.1 maltooligosyl trehalose hydrolase [Pedobacter psychrotolerans]GGE39602.1 malto-oligosyltrehalose trehalohydrolase [Pedobacter psychrotolerans]
MEIDIHKRKIGLNFNERGAAEVYLWAPYSSNVYLITNNLKLQLIKQDYGYWFLETDQIADQDSYCFEMIPFAQATDQPSETKHLQRSDPASLWQKEGVNGKSIAYNLNGFKWEDQDWNGIPLEEFIIYELHTGTFTENGDFKSIENKILYLKELGITAIELMPVAQFSGERNWGYDGVFPFAIQNSYGGPEALKHLINICHINGLAVILDVVYNHMGPEGNYFNDFGPYFTDKYQTPWGQAINFDDANCDPVRNYFIENVLMWFRDFHVDALRLDAVHAIKDFSSTHILQEIKQYVDQLSAQNGKSYQLIVELDLNDPKYINPTNKGGYGMDAQWADEFHHALRVAAGQEPNGYYAEFIGIEHLAKSYEDAYVNDGQYSPHRQKKFGAKAKNNTGRQFIVFSQNHDQVGNRMLGERTSELLSFEMTKLLAGAVFCSSFLPLIFMGEEYGETNRFQFFTSHSDQDLIEAVRKGRKSEFAAFHHGEETPDPQSDTTFLTSKLSWDRITQKPHESLLKFYKALINLRKTYKVMSVLDRNHVKAIALADQNCLILERWHEDEKILCLMNFSDHEQTLNLKYSFQYQNIFNSASVLWGGISVDDSIPTNNKITLLPESIQIFLCKNV